MKIKIIDADTKVNLEIDLKNIYLSENNPRHTIINQINEELEKYILGDKTYKKNEKKIFKKLLESEGDFSDLNELLTCINNIGFNSSDPLYLIKDNNNFIVAEGNRRIMCLKLMTKYFELPKWKSFIDSLENFYSNESTNNLNDLLSFEKTNVESLDQNVDNVENKRKTNFENCRSLIKNIQEKYSDKEFEVMVKIVAGDDDLWKYIYGKHLTGEEPGLRKWSRSKYFADLLSMFPNGISDENQETQHFLLFKFRRRFDLVKADYRIAQFIYYVIYCKYSQYENYSLNNSYDKQILNRLIQLNRVSALEPTHSYNKIRIFICNEILNIDQDEFKKYYFDFGYDEFNNILNFKINRIINVNKMLNFIYDNWDNGILTTRPIKKEHYENLKSQLMSIIHNIDLSKRLDEKDIKNINEFDLSIEQLDKIITTNEISYDKEILYRFRLAKNIKENNKIIKKENFKTKLHNIDFEPVNIFNILIEQYQLIDEKYLHAKAATIRAILEQFRIWTYTWILDEATQGGKKDNDTSNTYRECFEILCNNKSTNFEREECKEQEECKKTMKSHLNNFLKDEEKIIKFLNNPLNKGKIDNKNINIFLDILQNKEFSTSLNECIHSFHRMFQKKKYRQYLGEFVKNQEYIINILKHLNLVLYSNLNEKIKKRISEAEQDI